MKILQDFFLAAWNYKISLLPVLATYLLFDLQAIYRRATKRFYVPIYFLIFPNGHSDKLYAEYFSEDDFYGEGDAMSPAEKKLLRHKIIVYAILSMLFATIFAPYLCGLISALYLSHQQFKEFLVFFIIVKTSLILYSLHNIRQTSRVVNSGLPFVYVSITYIFYIYFVWRGLTKSFNWASINLDREGEIGLILALGDLVHEEFFINILAVGLLTWVVQQKITEPKNISPLTDNYDPSNGEAITSAKSLTDARTDQ